MPGLNERIAMLSEEQRRLLRQRLSDRKGGQETGGLSRAVRFTLFFFSMDEAELRDDKYRLVLEAARLADENGLTAVWTPERHFHSFGGLYPSPAVLSSALAATTRQIQIRAGSVVLPLHHPVRVAEEWSVIDNLSNGRVGLSLASGWSVQDFIFAPDRYADRKEIMFRDIDLLRKLWRGEEVAFTVDGKDIEIAIHPRPVQPEIPIWVTSSGTAETCREAGRIGANLLTALLRQGIPDVARNIATYRDARAEGGFDPDTGIASVMMHTYLGADEERVRSMVREPLTRYLSSYVDLAKESAEHLNVPVGQSDLSERSIEAVVNHAVDRYTVENGLFGTPRSVLPTVERLSSAGVDEIACLLDFGLEPAAVLDGIKYVVELRDLITDGASRGGVAAGGVPLSAAQRQLYLLDRLSPGNPAYHVRLGARITGPVDQQILHRAVTAVEGRHKALRSRIVLRSGEPELTFTDETRVDVRLLATSSEHLAEAVRREVRDEFDLTAKQPLWRVTLISTSSRNHVLVVTLHHIIADAWSARILETEIMTLYRAWSENTTLPVERVLPERSRPAVVAETSAAEAEDALGYWMETLSDPPPIPRILAGAPAPGVIAREGKQVRFAIDAGLSAGLVRAARDTGATMYMIALSAYAIAIASRGREQDIVIGCPVADRDRQDLKSAVGLLTNSVAIRVNLQGNPTLGTVLERVRHACLAAYQRKSVPLSLIVEKLNLQPRRPLYSTTFALQPMLREPAAIDGLVVERYEIDSETAKYPLSVEILEGPDGLTGFWEYATGMFRASDVGELHARFVTVLSGLVADRDRRIESLYEEFVGKEDQRMASTSGGIRGGGRTARRTVDVGGHDLVSTTPWGSLGRPLVIAPNRPSVNLVEWASDHKDSIEQHLLDHGGVLFDGFSVRADEFKLLVESLSGPLLEDPGRYDRRGPRENLYISTRYPHEHEIFMHNEMWWQNSWPMKIFFCCAEAPAEGGATLMADCRRVLDGLAPDIVESFRDGILHIRNFGPKVGLLAWQDVFQTDDRSVVEGICRSNRIEWEWRSDDCLHISYCRPAIAHHPRSHEALWFNYIALHHMSTNTTSEMAKALQGFGPDEVPMNIYYADGSEIPESVVEAVRASYRPEIISYPWKQGNVLLLDNMLAAHGREAYEGNRRILV